MPSLLDYNAMLLAASRDGLRCTCGGKFKRTDCVLKVGLGSLQGAAVACETCGETSVELMP